MRTTLAIALMMSGLLATPLWAQFGGGMSGGATGYEGGMMGGPGGYGMEGGGYGEMGMGMGSGMPGRGPGSADGIQAYGRSGQEGGELVVTWSGSYGAESQKTYESLRQMPSKLQFVDTPLSDVVRYFEQTHGISMMIDEAELEAEGMSSDLPVTIRLEGLSATVALDLMTERLGLGWYIDKGVVVISSEIAVEEHQSVRIYKLNQLSASGAKQVVQQIVTPDAWKEETGMAQVVAVTDRNLLVICHNAAGHAEIESLLKSLEAVK